MEEIEKKSKFDEKFWELIEKINNKEFLRVSANEKEKTIYIKDKLLRVNNEYFLELCNNYKFYIQISLF